MTIKRYSIDSDAQNRLTVKQTSVGDFVSYADYEALKDKMDMIHDLMEVAAQANALAKEGVEKLGKERNALAAENAQMLRLLTDISDNHVEYLSEGEGYMYAGVPLDYVSEINMYVSRDVNAENPFTATDTVLADIEARGVEKLLTSDPAELIAAMPAYRQMTVSEDNVRDALNAVRATLELRKGAAV